MRLAGVAATALVLMTVFVSGCGGGTSDQDAGAPAERPASKDQETTARAAQPAPETTEAVEEASSGTTSPSPDDDSGVSPPPPGAGRPVSEEEVYGQTPPPGRPGKVPGYEVVSVQDVDLSGTPDAKTKLATLQIVTDADSEAGFRDIARDIKAGGEYDGYDALDLLFTEKGPEESAEFVPSGEALVFFTDAGREATGLSPGEVLAGSRDDDAILVRTAPREGEGRRTVR